MAKITYIGAGSTSFGKRLMIDVMTCPALADGTLALVDINPEALARAEALARKIARQLGVPTRIEASTERRAVLGGSDYVLFTVEAPGGVETRIAERRISRKYGVEQIVGCTTGLGGVFRAMRYMPLMLDICRDMEELCPDAYLLHYANPTSTVPWALNLASKIKSVGLCHSVQGTAQLLASYCGVPYEETGHWAAGVNHQAWMLRFEWRGQDMYPVLREKMADPAFYQRDIVRFEMLKAFGYFVTESSGHNSEYVPYFRKNAELIRRFTPDATDGVAFQTATLEYMAKAHEQLKHEAFGDEPLQIENSHEYCVGIMNALETNQPLRFNGNVPNTGLITNLPPGACVEVPCLVDNMGIHPCYVGALPMQCAALNANRIAGDGLAVKAALEGDREAAFQAVALDPLTAALCTLDQIRDMVNETFAASAPYLPQFR
ncbi:MAG: alpha-galactosidase [Chloroflexi bacterium]|nr:alpha-galactosidase [Chloroflexota bacterium]